MFADKHFNIITPSKYLPISIDAPFIKEGVNEGIMRYNKGTSKGIHKE